MSRNATHVVALVVLALLGACREAESNDQMGAPKQQGSAMMSDAAAMTDNAEYTVVVKSHWTKANFPFEYPEAGVVTGPHFSGVIGASHNTSYSLFKEGALPTAGLERLSEEGKHSPLDTEIKGALANGSVGALFESDPLRNFADSIVTTVKVDKAHPMVSLVAMVAPSPDWFTGASNVSLMENGQWVGSRSVELYAYDSGGDDGTTYKAADKDNNPKKPTMQRVDGHFAPTGTAKPVGTLVITRK